MLWRPNLTIFHPNWQKAVKQLASSEARRVYLDGRSPTSREPADSPGFEYQVVTGDRIRRHLPWLFDLYHNDVCKLAASASGHSLVPSDEDRACININVVTGANGRYEWHVDSNPVTAILFATTLAEGDGGEFAYRQGPTISRITPVAGDLVVFMAEEVEHAVLPLRRDITRISIPMTYYLAGQEQRGYDLLDDYLYGED